MLEKASREHVNSVCLVSQSAVTEEETFCRPSCWNESTFFRSGLGHPEAEGSLFVAFQSSRERFNSNKFLLK